MMSEVQFDKDTIIAIIEKQFKHPEQQFVLSTMTADGFPDARLMGNICQKSMQEVYFTCQTGSRKTEEILHNSKSSVYFTFDGTTVWLYGHATVTRDESERSKIWNDRMLHIYKEGVDSPRLTVIKIVPTKIRFRAKTTNYIEIDL